LYVASILKKMSKTQTLTYFYHRQGVYFTWAFFKILAKNFLLSFTLFASFLFAFKTKAKITAILSVIITGGFIVFTTNQLSFSFLPILVFACILLNWKTLAGNLPLKILAFSATLFSLKIFWGLIIANYGSFFVSVLLIALFALIKDKLNLNEKHLGVYVLLVGATLAFKNTDLVNKYLINTNRGGIYADKALQMSTDDLIQYINKNTKKSDKIVVFPEGAMVNFLTKRDSDNFFTSLIPLYVETFGEDEIINHFKGTKPDYIVFNNWNTKDYYFKYICEDYAQAFCSFVVQNYSQVKLIDNGFRYLIFKRNS